MTSLTELDPLARALRDRRDRLANEVLALNHAITALQQNYLPAIKRHIAGTVGSHSDLYHAIDESRHLFVKPRTAILHGIQIGLRKGTGGLTWDDDAKTVALIEKHFTKPQADLLIKTKKTPITKALEDLDAADLKRIGCRLEDTGDHIIIKPVDTAVDKLVAALMKSAVEETQIESEQEAA